jgi:hypothetical protein
MRNIIDTWSIIEEFEVKGYEIVRDVVLIPEAEYDRLLETVANRKYIRNLRH